MAAPKLLGGSQLLEVAGLLAALGFVAVAFAELSKRLGARLTAYIGR